MKTKIVLKVIVLIVTAVVLVVLFAILNPLVFLPHPRISIALPFAPEVDSRTTLIPYGEKIEHNEKNGNPNGHEGIDFGWNERTAVLASHDGRITGIVNTSEGINITVSTMYYKTVYKELADIPKELKVFSKVKQGDVLGYIHLNEIQGNMHGQVHWEFSSSSMIVDRLCPVNYFDTASKARIEAIWAAMPANDRFKKEYPEICNGAFAGKEK